ncbi:unnamed protein product [Paramecium primaurelia]|uniref:Transmembrane protein n=1 Tax=Paramecium primaurelia TaxID=5886 RepID=A0A8S1Q082_PARPR|nr:unnamed protein product [Paramecium primaurelia]
MMKMLQNYQCSIYLSILTNQSCFELIIKLNIEQVFFFGSQKNYDIGAAQMLQSITIKCNFYFLVIFQFNFLIILSQQYIEFQIKYFVPNNIRVELNRGFTIKIMLQGTSQYIENIQQVQGQMLDKMKHPLEFSSKKIEMSSNNTLQTGHSGSIVKL